MASDTPPDHLHTRRPGGASPVFCRTCRRPLHRRRSPAGTHTFVHEALYAVLTRTPHPTPATLARGPRLARTRGHLHAPSTTVLATLVPGRGRITPDHPLGLWQAPNTTPPATSPPATSSPPT